MGHLWRRPSGFVFQLHIPQRFVESLGRTPIRIRLGPLPRAEANWFARILAGRGTVMLERGMGRDVLSRSLAALAAELEALRKEEFRAGVRALPTWFEEGEDPELIVHHQARRKIHEAQRDTLRGVRQRLDGLGAALSQDGAAWEAERAMHDRLVDRLASTTSALPASVEVAQGPSTPLLSTTIDAYLSRKREDEVGKAHVDGLPRRFRGFIEHVGDKPIDQYTASDLQSFTSTLARVPATWSKEAEIKDLSARAASEWNIARRQPLPRMSETTIRLGYARPIRTWFAWLALEHRFPNPFAGMRLAVPKSAKNSVRRKPLTMPELTRWLAYAERQSRPDDRFLPLLGFLTGARIAELVFTQARDLRQFGDAWALSLAEPLIVDGREVRRPLKNANSARLVALHDTLVEAGFIKWAMDRPPNGWLFPHLHQADIVRPSDTASKRMSRSMKAAGVHEPLVKVFHSLRHNSRDWLERVVKLPDSIVRRQMGHAAEDTAETYGEDPLLPEEVQRIARAPLPEDLDITPYLPRKGRR